MACIVRSSDAIFLYLYETFPTKMYDSLLDPILWARKLILHILLIFTIIAYLYIF